jgi:spermidine dehydrogenase
MNNEDKALGMDRDISRRDVIVGAAALGVGVAASSLLMPNAASAQMAPGTQDTPGYYPPELQGMRGSHPGSFEAAHAIRDGKVVDSAVDIGEHYDLVIVGAGMSGLGAAYFFRRALPHGRVLILDNHDDFGGHARRNEFIVDGRKVIGYGGTMYILSPDAYTVEGRQLLTDVGINKERFLQAAGPRNALAARFNLKQGMLFDKETFGVDKLVVGQPSRAFNASRDARTSPAEWKAFLDRTPLHRDVRESFLRMNTESKDYLAGLDREEREKTLRSISYTDYLLKYAKVHPGVIPLIIKTSHGGINGVAGLDTVSAWGAFENGRPGFDGLGIPRPPYRRWMSDHDGDDLHFPDGNHGLARLIVRWLIPEALPGQTQEDSVTKRVDYTKLDAPANAVRLRLSSTVARVTHIGSPQNSSGVNVIYIRGGKPYRVQADAVVMAGYNAMIPYIAPEVPEAQKAALHNAVRMPLVYGTVVLRNWESMAKLGSSGFSCPGPTFWWDSVSLDWTVSLGDYQAAQSPSDPIPLHLSKVPAQPGLSAKDQFRAGRAQLLATDFESIERATRRMFLAAFGPAGFDPARDIGGITVNRHPHGYAGCANELYDPIWAPEERPWVLGRKRVGRIAIANSDAGAICLTQCAFDQAHRAVTELIADVLQPMQQYPWGVQN